jgi:signal peptidase I
LEGARVALFSRHRSYTEKVFAKRRRRKFLGRTLLFLLLIALLRTFFVQSYTLRGKNMEPLLVEGDSLLVFPLPLGARTWFGKTPALSDIERGELVVVDPDPIPSVGRFFALWDSIARFFSLQRYSPLARRYGAAQTSPGIYRVVGLPGDRIRRNKAVYEIQRGSGGAYLPEQSLTDNPYELRSVSSSGGLLGIGDFSETLELGPGQYFVEGDNRESFNGSSLWGPVGIDRISGRVILVYWPIKHLRIL